MRRLAFPVLLTAAGLAVLGNGPANPGSFSVHQPVVSRADYTLDLQTDGYGRLARGEGERAATWLSMLHLDYGDHVSVDGDGGKAEIASVVADYGLLLDAAPPVTTGAVPRGTARLIVSRARATVTGCPDWSRASSPEWSGSTMSNYGCATETNLAQMIANPDDLVRGQTGALGGSDAQTVGKAIKLYRDQPATGTALKTESTSSSSSGGSK